MTKKTRLPFSSLSIENEKAHIGTENKAPLRNATHHPGSAHHHVGIHKSGDKKRSSKSSTYQYSKGGHGKPQGGNSYGAKNKKNVIEYKIPPVEAGVIRVIPL